MLSSDLNAKSDKELCSCIGNLKDTDFDKYFDSDDQELLEAMKNYEMDVCVKPEWFGDLEESEFYDLPQTETNKSGKSGDSTSQNNYETDSRIRLTAKIDGGQFPSVRHDRTVDSGYSDKCYVDPSWFDEDLS